MIHQIWRSGIRRILDLSSSRDFNMRRLSYPMTGLQNSKRGTSDTTIPEAKTDTEVGLQIHIKMSVRVDLNQRSQTCGWTWDWLRTPFRGKRTSRDSILMPKKWWRQGKKWRKSGLKSSWKIKTEVLIWRGIKVQDPILKGGRDRSSICGEIGSLQMYNSRNRDFVGGDSSIILHSWGRVLWMIFWGGSLR